MEEYVYSVLYRKELLEVNNYHYLFYPCYVVKGIFDEESGIFLDELNKSRYSYINSQVIYDESNYCVGEIFTEKDLHRMFPASNNMEDMLKKLFEEEEKYLSIGKYDVINDLIRIGKSEFNDDINTDNSMAKALKNVKLEYADEDNEYEENYSQFYLDIKKQFGYDFVLFTKENLEEINEMDDLEDIQDYIFNLETNKDLYEESFNASENENGRKLIKIFSEDATEEMYEMTSVDVLKKFLNDNFPKEETIIQSLKSEGLDSFKELKNISELELKKIEQDKDVEIIKKDLMIISNKYKENIEKLLYFKKFGYNFDTALTNYNIQVLGINEMLKLDNLENIRQFYIALQERTATNYEQIEKEFIILKEPSKEKMGKEEKQKKEQDINIAIDEAISKLNKLIGLENVKKTFEEIFSDMLFKIRTSDNLKFENEFKHMVFTGNPGTGKTTVAEIVGPLFHKLGYLKNNKIAYIAAQDLIGEYVGHTAPKTEKLIKKNSGGLIVLDEAYILAGEAQQFGNEAIAVMLKEMEKNNTMFIFAGYKKEMDDFIDMNSGFNSRIGNFIEFKDYNEEELLQIFNQTVKNTSLDDNQEKKLTLTPGALEKVKKTIHIACEKENFGNGRFVKKLFSNISKQHAKNTRNNSSDESLYTIVEEDIEDDILDKILFDKGKIATDYKDSNIGFNCDLKPKQKIKTKEKLSPMASRN